MEASMIEQLGEEQLKAFDIEFVYDQLWMPIKCCIDRDFPDGRFTFLDIGGGNGLFADRILSNYPSSQGVVLDNSSFLLNRNQPNKNKRTILGSVAELGRSSEERYDLVFFNWLLHHLVSRSSYSQSRRNIDSALRSARLALTERGRVSIYENMYNGLILDGAPSWIVYRLTSAKTIARLVRKKGANTAGTGVCFLSHRQWCSTIQAIGLRILDYTSTDPWVIPWSWKALLHIRDIRYGHFWLCQG